MTCSSCQLMGCAFHSLSTSPRSPSLLRCFRRSAVASKSGRWKSANVAQPQMMLDIPSTDKHGGAVEDGRAVGVVRQAKA